VFTRARGSSYEILVNDLKYTSHQDLQLLLECLRCGEYVMNYKEMWLIIYVYAV
jgi:hypothetical protein